MHLNPSSARCWSFCLGLLITKPYTPYPWYWLKRFVHNRPLTNVCVAIGVQNYIEHNTTTFNSINIVAAIPGWYIIVRAKFVMCFMGKIQGGTGYTTANLHTSPAQKNLLYIYGFLHFNFLFYVTLRFRVLISIKHTRHFKCTWQHWPNT